jgi:four helix bundle protein
MGSKFGDGRPEFGENNMTAPKSFEELEAWQAARELTNEVYALGRREPLVRDLGLGDQLGRAAVSIMNNIAEGWESFHAAEKIQFYNGARRSCGEVRSMSYVLLDNRYISETEHDALRERCVRCAQLVSGLIRFLKNRS